MIIGIKYLCFIFYQNILDDIRNNFDFIYFIFHIGKIHLELDKKSKSMTQENF